MTDEDGDDVDPANPRPHGHYPRFDDNEWHYVSDELAQTISLGPAGDGEEGQDWVLTYTPERRNQDNREKVLVRLTPRALHELYIETKNLSTDQRMAGHSAECDLCGEQVDLDEAIPNKREEPVHRRCYVDAYGGPEWLKDY
jgi:phosphatidylserine/phosphatidylglycerophosphate/cardiolipin synthase-like enzyme